MDVLERVDADAAIVPGLHRLHVVFAAAQRRDRTLVDNNAIADDTDLVVTGDLALGDVATGDNADLRDAEIEDPKSIYGSAARILRTLEYYEARANLTPL
jgi:hypothetical protein